MAAVKAASMLMLRPTREIRLYPVIRCFSSIKLSDPIPSEDKETHTGQKWDCDDYRLARFIHRPKHVNPNFAIDLINSVPPEPKKERVVWCDGGGGPTGHPRVYINLDAFRVQWDPSSAEAAQQVLLDLKHILFAINDKPGNHICGYCGLRFCKEGGHH